MRRLVAGWALFWTAAGLLFWHADRHGYALCKAVRHVYGTNTPTGRKALALSLGAGVTVLYRHLVKAET